MSAAQPESSAGTLKRIGSWLRAETVRRSILVVVLAFGTALLTVDYDRVPTGAWAVGDLAERDIRATTALELVDTAETLRQQQFASASVLKVFDLDETLANRVTTRVRGAFVDAREQWNELRANAAAEGRTDLTEEEVEAVYQTFQERLELTLDPADLQRLLEVEWAPTVEESAVEMISIAMRSYIIADRSTLGSQDDAVSVVRILSPDRRDEIRLDDFGGVVAPELARRQITLWALENSEASAPRTKAAVSVSRAAVRPNFSYNQLLTENRRTAARRGVAQVVERVPKGTVIVREGDRVDARAVLLISELQQSRSSHSFFGGMLALAAMSGLLFIALFQFATGYIKKFAREPRQLEAMAILIVLSLGMGRLAVELSGPLTIGLGLGMQPSGFWYLVPFAGFAMLTRILVNSESAIVWILAASALLGVLMDQQVLFAVFFAVSGVTAAGALAHIRERVGVLRAGLLTGLVNAAAALLLNLVAVHIGDVPLGVESATQPLWDLSFAFLGGVLSGIVVLGLVPVFELFGFVTDYRLLELANLNHPLLRQLMLRAPGTYHHSVTVAQLCEAAAERIGANALQTRVACYFHDIGKAVNPKYFIENQRGGPNPHDRMPARTSARVIQNHVEDGEAIARQYNLPQPIIDGIVMHHGNGLIQYFYAKAVREAGPDEVVDESDYRYRGSPPNSRETGIMMLADKVEAACRTLPDKSQEKIRALIQKIVNAAIIDGQLEQCPLTIKELYDIVDAFTDTLLGIYHHRIEYPGIPQRRAEAQRTESPSGPIITLDTAPVGGGDTSDDAVMEAPTVPVQIVDPSTAAGEDDYVAQLHETGDGSRRPTQLETE